MMNKATEMTLKTTKKELDDIKKELAEVKDELANTKRVEGSGSCATEGRSSTLGGRNRKGGVTRWMIFVPGSRSGSRPFGRRPRSCVK